MDLAGGTFLTSGTFWGGAGAVIGLISIIAIVWVTIHVARPKRRLLVSITAVPLLAPSANLAGRLTITFDRDTVQAPYVATITLRSRGRHLDIPRSAFDGDKPMELVTTAEIIGIVDVTTDRGRTKPAVTSATNSHRLMIEPCLIKWDQTIVISILTEGEPELGPLPQHLENIEIVRIDPTAGVSLRATLGASMVEALKLSVPGVGAGIEMAQKVRSHPDRQ